MAYDILIKSGLILDGTGKDPLFADIGIKDKKIADIGALTQASAATVIDAQGKYVTPGFIDITNHSDTHLTIFKYPQLESLVMQGITTIIGGNCGASLAPLASPFAIHAIDKWTDTSSINISWNSVEEFLEQIDKIHLGVNFGTLLGYGTLRRGIIHDEIRLLTFEEREKTKYLLQQGVRQGAFGLSLGLAYGHERASPTEEIVEIARGLNGTHAVIKIHLRWEGADLLSSVNEAIRIGRETGSPIQISHLKAIGRKAWPSLKKALEMIKAAQESGLDIHFDISPYSTTGSLLYLLIPSWARQGGFQELFSRIDDPAQYAQIIQDLRAVTLHYNRILITSAKTKTIVGKTISQLANYSGLDPAETLVKLVRANEGRVSMVGRTMLPKNIQRAMIDACAFIASDGEGYGQEELNSGNLVHPRSFGAFPHFWHRLVNDLKVLKAETAIQKITSGPAKKMGISERGILQKGNFADIVVFDPNLIKDRATYLNPFRFPAGIEYVIVNGKMAVQQGRYLGVRAGMVLRKK